MENMCNMFAHLLTWWGPQYHLVWLRGSTLRVELLSCCFQIAESELKRLRSENVQDDMYWLVVSTPLENMKVNWDDYSQYMEKHVPNHQPVYMTWYDMIVLLPSWTSMTISQHTTRQVLQSSPVFRGHLGLKFDPVQSPGKWQLTNVVHQGHELRLNWSWVSWNGTHMTYVHISNNNDNNNNILSIYTYIYIYIYIIYVYIIQYIYIIYIYNIVRLVP